MRGGQRNLKPLPGLLLSFLRQILVVVTAVLVYTELFWNALIWGTLATVAIVIPGTADWKQSPQWMYDRFQTYLGWATNPKLAIYSTPLIGRFVSLHKKDLEDLSLIFRLLSFVLVET